MGDPKRPRKKYERPLKPWDRAVLEESNRLAGMYGLRNKRELWRAEYMARKYRRMVREALALHPEEAAQILKPAIQRLQKLGILGPDATPDDMLDITAKDFLERRLQTLVWKKGLAKSPFQARQWIVHGHVWVAGRRIRSPGYLVPVSEEDAIECTHPEYLRALPGEEAPQAEAPSEAPAEAQPESPEGGES
ncbi:MAG: 30S ribosomal protein S4 [Candidatus Korarchaeota archaeon]|nr:30S ribosomal protein S4 [Candidatus Korarchaeota archaeon]